MTLVGTASSQVIIQHQGTNNPTTEGWTQSFVGGADSVGPGTDASPHWRLTDPNNGSAINYTKTLPAAYVVSSNWSMTARLRVVDITSGWEYIPQFFVDDGINFWNLTLWKGGQTTGSPGTGNPNLPAGVYTFEYPAYMNVATLDVTNAYHSYEMRMNRHGSGTADDEVDVYVDGVFANSITRASEDASFATGFIGWGSGNSNSGSQSNWSHVFFEVPEPTAIAWLAFGGLLLVRRRRA